MRDVPGLDLLAFTRLTFEMRPLRTVRLPPFLGSTLRGAFGVALRETGCPRRCANASLCPLRDTCAYAYCFETPPPPDADRLRNLSAVPHPYHLVAPRERRAPWTPRDVLRWNMVLVGRGIEFFPHVLAAAERMAEAGLGAERAPFGLEAVRDHDGTVLWMPGGPAFVPPHVAYARELFDARAPGEVTLGFRTPVRIVANGRLARPLTFRAFARALLGRVSSLVAFHCGGSLDIDFRGALERAARAEVVADRLRPVRVERHSSRQGRAISLDGLVGEVAWRGDAVAELWPLVRLGELLHVGKGTSLGLGRYEIERVA